MHTENLDSLVEIWESTCLDDELARATLRTALHVARALQDERAMLLPEASRFFLQTYLPGNSDEAEPITLQCEEGTIKFTSKWLLKQLQLHLHRHMDYKCVHKKFGTVLFRKGGDLMISLSWALGRAGSNTTEAPYTVQSMGSNDAARTLAIAGDLVNDLIHKENAKISSDDWKSGFNLDDQIGATDPTLWEFIRSITRSSRDRLSTAAANDDTDHVKRVRRFFLLALMKFTANTQKPAFIHTLLADDVEVCGGSRKLITTLNRLGVTSSPDTHDRFITEVATMQRNKSLWDDLMANTLTLATVDNYDVLQSHAAVYCGDQQRSTHAVTLQIAQPNPAHITTNTPGSPPTAVATKRQSTHSPESSPHQLGKIGPKRPRTVATRSLAE